MAVFGVVLALPGAAPYPAAAATPGSALATGSGSGVAAGPGPGYRAPAALYRWPLDGVPAVLRPFDPPARPWLPGHRGVDLAGLPGVTVRACGAGVVAFAGVIAGRGVVSVRHGDGLRTTYEPVEPVAVAGAQISAGAPVGVLAAGHPGCLAPACLHWGLRKGEDYLDPLGLVGVGRVRLFPLPAAEEGG